MVYIDRVCGGQQLTCRVFFWESKNMAKAKTACGGASDSHGRNAACTVWIGTEEVNGALTTQPLFQPLGNQSPQLRVLHSSQFCRL